MIAEVSYGFIFTYVRPNRLEADHFTGCSDILFPRSGLLHVIQNLLRLVN